MTPTLVALLVIVCVLFALAGLLFGVVLELRDALRTSRDEYKRLRETHLQDVQAAVQRARREWSARDRAAVETERATPHGDAERAATPTGGDAAPAAPEGKHEIGSPLSVVHYAGLLIATHWQGELATGRKFHDDMQNLMDAYDCLVDRDPTQAQEPRSSEALPPRTPEGNDALRALNEMLAWVDDGDNGALLAFAEAFEGEAEPTVMAELARVVVRERLIGLAPQANADAHPPSASPQSAPEGITDAMVEAALDEWLRDGKGDRHRYPTADAIMRDGMRRALAAALDAEGKGKA